MKRAYKFITLAVFLSALILMLVSAAWATTYRGKVQTTDATFGSGDSFYNKNISLIPYSPAIPTALTITGGTTILNGSNVQGWRGIFVDPSGTYAMVKLYGASVSTLPNIIPRSYWAAVAAEGLGANAEIFDSSITGNGIGTHGVLAANSAHVSISNSSVSANGINSNGLYAYGGDYYIAMNGGSVTANGVGGHAVKAEGHTDAFGIVLNDITVTANGVGSNGLYADNGGSISTLRGSVTANGAAGHAVKAEGSDSGVLLDNTIVVTNGLLSNGLYADNGGYITMSEGSVSTSGIGSNAARSSGDGSEIELSNVDLSTTGIWDSSLGLFSYGLYADDEGYISMEGGSVTTYGDYAHGVKAEDLNSLAELDGDVVITTHGENSYGLYSDPGGVIYMDGGSVTTYGDYAHAVRSSGLGSEAYLTNVSLYTEGTDAYGLYADDEGYIKMKYGLIDSLSGTYMYVDDGYLDLYDVAAGKKDAESLLVTDSSGTVNVYDYSELLGNVRHTGSSDGALDLYFYSGSSLFGRVNADIDNPNANINVTLDDNDTVWYVTGDSTTQGLLANGGTVDYLFSETADPLTMSFVVPDGDYSDYKTVTVADFVGIVDNTPGVIKMKADIEGNQGDFLSITGAATGENLIDVQNISNSGAERMDALIVADNGAESTAEFSLADTDGVVDAGAWNYVLAEEMNGNAKEWYLKRNSLTSVGQGIVGSVVDSEIWYTEVGTLFDRLKVYKDGYAGGVWANAVAKKVEFDGGFGSVFDEEFRTVSLGYDKKLDRDNGVLYQGGMIGYGTADRDITNNIGNTDIDSFHASLYSIYRSNNGYYAAGLLKFNHYKSDMTINKLDDFSAALGESLGFNTVTGEYENNGFGVSLMLGKRIDHGNNGWYWEPQLQMSWMKLAGDDYTTNSGIDVDISDSDSIQARGGIMLGRSVLTSNGMALDIYGKASIVHEFDGETDITMSGGKWTSDLGGTWGVYEVGLNWQITQKSYFNASFQCADGDSRTQPWGAQVGFSFEM